MDVSPWIHRGFFSAIVVLGALFLTACGNRFDLSTERGRRARIDDANFHLSRGQCGAALEAISPLYNSPQVDDEVRVITASAYACGGTFNLLTLVGNLVGASNYLSALAKSLSNANGDGARSALFAAVDVLTRSGSLMNAVNRSTRVNTYMVFVQMGVVASILRNYGSPAADGSQGANLVYETAAANPAGEMSNVDACALSSAVSILADSFSYSSLSDADSQAVVNVLNGICSSVPGATGCGDLNRDRTACTGLAGNTPSEQAEALVTGINAGW